MLHCSRRPLTWALNLLVILAVTASGAACAVSRLFDRPAGVVLRGGKPCLYAPPARIDTDAKPAEWIDIGVAAVDASANARGVWDIDIKVARPSSPDQCVVYGAPTPTQNVRLAAQPLPAERKAYRAILGVGTPGSKDSGRYGIFFCYGNDDTGQPALTVWDAKTSSCTKEPLPALK
jgi:hypothetical protein